MEETSLDDFLGDGTPEVAGDDGAEAGAGSTDDALPSAPGAERIDPSSVPPATATSVWTPEPRPCDRCGAAVRRLWRDGDAAACRDCTDWADGG